MKARDFAALEQVVKKHNQGALHAYAEFLREPGGGVSWPRVASLKTGEAFQAHLAEAGIALPFDEALRHPSPLGEPFERGGLRVGQPLLHPAHGGLGRDDGTASRAS